MTKVLFFHADWCVPCQSMKDEVNEAVDKTGAVLEMVDVGTDAGADLANAYCVKSTPTLIAFGEDDDERLTGAAGIESIIDLIESVS